MDWQPNRQSKNYLFALFAVAYAQECDTLDRSIIKKYNKYSDKKLKKYFTKNIDPNESFNIAQYLRHKNDTTSKQWYQKTIDYFKANYHFGGKKNKEYKAKVLFIAGQCYYHIGNYKTAEVWFSKALATNILNLCAEQYKKLAMEKLVATEK